MDIDSAVEIGDEIVGRDVGGFPGFKDGTKAVAVGDVDKYSVDVPLPPPPGDLFWVFWTGSGDVLFGKKVEDVDDFGDSLADSMILVLELMSFLAFSSAETLLRSIDSR